MWNLCISPCENKQNIEEHYKKEEEDNKNILKGRD